VIRPVAKSVADQVADGQPCLAVVCAELASLEAEAVETGDFEFEGVLDRDDAVVLRMQFDQGVEESGFYGSGTSGDQNVTAGTKQFLSLGKDGTGVGARCREVLVMPVGGRCGRCGYQQDRRPGPDEAKRESNTAMKQAAEPAAEVGAQETGCSKEKRKGEGDAWSGEVSGLDADPQGRVARRN